MCEMRDEDHSTERLIRDIEDFGKRIDTLKSSRTPEASDLLLESEDLLRRMVGILRNSQEVHETVLSAISDAIFITDDFGRFIYICPNVDVIFGFSGREIGEMGGIGALLGEELFSPDELRDSKEIRSIKRTIRDKAGRKHVLQITVKRLSITGGGILYVCRDVTEFKRVEKSLRVSEEKYRNIFENAPVGIFQTSVEGKILSANPALARMLGFESPEELGSTISNVEQLYVHPDARQRGVTKVLQLSTPLCFETHLRRRDGLVITAGINIRAARNREGTVCCLEGLVEDITERKQAEERLKESELQFRRMFDQSPIGAAIVSPDYRFMRVNEQLCCITGYSEEELLSLRLPDITHPDDLPSNLDHMYRLMAGEIDQYRVEKRYICKDGNIVWVHVCVRTIKDGLGRPIYFMPMVEDITRRRCAEEALRKAHDELEIRVRERTAELQKAISKMLEEIKNRDLAKAGLRQREAELIDKSRELEGVNSALRFLLKQREEDKKELEEKILCNVREMVIPYVERLKYTRLDNHQQLCVKLVEEHLNEIISPFMRNLLVKHPNLTPMEMEVGRLVQKGWTAHQIAELLHVSTNTIRFHKANLRSKFGLKSRKVNLRSYLQSFN